MSWLNRLYLKYLGWRRRILYSQPYEKIELLVNRCVERMKLKPLCPFCGSEMKFRFSVIVGEYPIRDDQTWKCKNCFHTAHFGVPLTRKEFDEEFKLRKGTYLLKPDWRPDERRKEIVDRLRALGYLGF